MRIFGLTFGRRATSLSPASKQEFVLINGRRVYVDGTSYALPNDAQEDQRLDLQHFLMRYVLQSSTAVPFDGRRIPYPRSVLDVACGTGRWAAEIAYAWPQANVVGIDIKKPSLDSPAILQGHTTPPANLVIDEADVRQPLPFADQSFAFVHTRFLVVAIGRTDWPNLIHEVVRVTQSGGWVEVVETNMRPAINSPAFQQFFAWFDQLTATRQYDLDAGSHVAGYLTHSGLRNVTTSTLNIPFGPWGGRLGGMLSADIVAALNGLSQPLVMSGITTKAAVDSVAAQMQRDIVSASAASTYPTVPFTFVYGQKP